MPGTLSIQELAFEADTNADLIDRLVGIGALSPTDSGQFRPGDVIRVETVKAFLDSELTIEDLRVDGISGATAILHGSRRRGADHG
jgi:hypothetical protein